MTGYKGPLCGVCEEGYFENDNECLQCTNSSTLTPTMIVFICIVILFVMASLMSCSVKLKIFTVDADDGAATDNKKLNDIQLLFLWLKSTYKNTIVKIKIIVSTFQVIIATATVLTVKMPKAFNSFTNGLSFFNLNFATVFPIGCSANFTFIDTLIMTTVAPMIVGAMLFVMFIFEYTFERKKIQANKERKKGDKKKAFNRIKSAYTNYFFYLSYLILPMVSTTIFKMFICTNIDPHNETSGESNYYLTADLNISCSSTYYKKGVLYACLMILVYPIGIPALYMHLLYQYRYEIMNRKKPKLIPVVNESTTNPIVDSDVEKEVQTRSRSSSYPTNQANVLPARVARLSFLWQSYKPQYWYWEIVDTSRRIILTAVLSVVRPGSSQQSILSVLLALLYIKIYGYFLPYDVPDDNILAEVGQFSIFFTFFGALVIGNSLLVGDEAEALGILLSMIDMCAVFISLYYIIIARRDDIRRLKAEFLKSLESAEQSDRPSLIGRIRSLSSSFSRDSRVKRESMETLELEQQYRSHQLEQFKAQREKTEHVSPSVSNNDDVVPRPSEGVEMTNLNPDVPRKFFRSLDETPDSDDESI